jgi:hypothetical protein
MPTNTPTATPTATSTPTTTPTRKPRPSATPAPVLPSPISQPAAEGIPGWNPRPIRVDCSLVGFACGFIFSVTVSQDYPDYYHSIELANDAGHSVILGREIVFANYVAVGPRDLQSNLVKGLPYHWRVVLFQASDNAIVARSGWSTDTYVQK